MRTFLGMTQQDAQAKGKHYLDMYDAESWYLAREIFVEGKHRSEFGRYLDLLRQDRNEADAFAASFSISYEDLDKELVLAMRERAHVYLMDAPHDPDAGREVAQRLSAAEVKARFALLSLHYKRGPDAVQLANEALQTEPANETALRALALGQFERQAYGESLAAVDRLAAQARSQAGYADRAEVLAGLARAAAHGEAKLPVDTATLRRRALEDYEHALAMDGDDGRSRDGLAQLQASP